MLQYVARRLLLMIPTIFLISLMVFFLVRLIPGDTVMMLLENASLGERDVEAYRAKLGLDRPVYVQYGVWITDVVRGDLGASLWSRQPIAKEILQRLPVTAELGAFAMFFSLLMAVPIGVVSAVRQDTWADYVSRSLAILGLAVPGFWLGTLVIVLPAIWLGWIPPIRYVGFADNPWGNVQQFLIPGFLLGLGLAAVVMRMTRSMMLEVLRQDYIRTAWSKGLRERAVVYRHALKNAMIPVVSILGVQIAVIAGGSVIFEQIFNLPGIGKFMYRAIQTRDYPVIQGVNLFLAGVIVWANFMVDVTYAYLDPRIRFK
ncbi:MAG: ABC transporter permease [Deltaproteobacteria bacterium]|nr:ABC transporter permease [Deltaproteobacteria bacterium]